VTAPERGHIEPGAALATSAPCSMRGSATAVRHMLRHQLEDASGPGGPCGLRRVCLYLVKKYFQHLGRRAPVPGGHRRSRW
jgi:hypothetical protein